VPLFVVLTVGALTALMFLAERRRPARKWPPVKTWWMRAWALNLVQIGMVFAAGSTWDRWMVRVRPFSADGLGLIGGAVVGYLAVTFVYYWWHRARHEVPFLWKWFHQVHHSPQRIELITSFYKHPFELLANGVLSSAIVYWMCGLDVPAATLAVTLTGVAELFYHWNVRTPYWVGFLIQRPESHLIHHQQGLHAFNYSDLPLWDVMFGTFRNPREWNAACGFAESRELRLREMLAGRDVNAP
jgi:sterol desaturase/sphingolipid hydroxylase (fatty acid hydroxylase superfamily)